MTITWTNREQRRRTAAVLRVGEGRGFVVKTVESESCNLIITAAHCLPFLPPAHPASYLQEGTYQRLLGPLGAEPTVWAECRFVDHVNDIAVLGSPDDQDLAQEAPRYAALTQAVSPVPIAEAPGRGPGWLLGLDGQWGRCAVQHLGGGLWISDAATGIAPGMSGSPILTTDGAAIGVVSVSGGSEGEMHTEDGPNPRLTWHLPAGLLSVMLRR